MYYTPSAHTHTHTQSEKRRSLVTNLSDYLLKSNMVTFCTNRMFVALYILFLLRYTIIVINLISEIVVVSSYLASLSLLSQQCNR